MPSITKIAAGRKNCDRIIEKIADRSQTMKANERVDHDHEQEVFPTGQVPAVLTFASTRFDATTQLPGYQSPCPS